VNTLISDMRPRKKAESPSKRKSKEMIEKTQQMGVPVIEIDDQIVIGFDEKELKKLLKI